MTSQELENEISSVIDTFKDILSPEIWSNILLDCTKNEVLILWLLYRKEQVNMSQIAEYINVPLNTATGIIARMEKKDLVVRQHSAEDKRIVKIQMSEKGQMQMQQIIKECMRYGMMIIETFSKEEIDLLYKMFRKITEILKKEPAEQKAKTKVKRIMIE